jgi:glycosyltransferase involved in cell wall biosynthesis
MLSIIIPTLNRGNLLTLTLNSLASQDFPPQNFEILIIDNGSTDNTKQVAERFIDQFPTRRCCISGNWDRNPLF